MTVSCIWPDSAQIGEQPAHLVIALLDQPHIGPQHLIAHTVLAEGLTYHIIGKGSIDRMRVVQLSRIAHHRQIAVRPIHIMIGGRHNIGPVRLDIGEMAQEGLAVWLAAPLFQKINHLAGQPGGFRILLADIGWQAGIFIGPARGDIASLINAGIGIIMPRIFAVIALLPQILHIGELPGS